VLLWYDLIERIRSRAMGSVWGEKKVHPLGLG
jgi:hypothetical protein